MNINGYCELLSTPFFGDVDCLKSPLASTFDAAGTFFLPLLSPSEPAL